MKEKGMGITDFAQMSWGISSTLTQAAKAKPGQRRSVSSIEAVKKISADAG